MDTKLNPKVGSGQTFVIMERLAQKLDTLRGMLDQVTTHVPESVEEKRNTAPTELQGFLLTLESRIDYLLNNVNI